MRHRTERGGATVELTLATPLLLMLLLLAVAGGRLVNARMEVDDVAYDAARAASIERNASAAVVAANQVVGDSDCQSPQVEVDTAAFYAGGRVSVSVTCAADLSGLSLLRLPGTKSLHARSTATIDTFRGTM